ncbi:MAG: hypothetical protein O3B95_02490 [Chloroflexi bacterium]|nr:hypothetical protein [Chloroflexota bacterium]
MITISQRNFGAVLRVGVAAIAALLLFAVVVGPSSQTTLAAGNKSSVYGTVTSEPENGQIKIATRSGVMTLILDSKSTIRGKSKKFSIADVQAGMKVAGYYRSTDDGPVVGNLTFTGRSLKRSFEHVVGVVIEKKGKTLTIQKQDGEQVEIVSPDEDRNDDVEPGNMIATVVEEDEETGELEVTAVQTATETIEQLKNLISNEIGAAQRKLLEARISETASVHLTRLYETLDTIEAETRARIEAAYSEYQVAYEKELKEISGKSLSIQISGEVVSITPLKITVKSDSDGTTWALEITESTTFEKQNGSAGTIADVAPAAHVEIDAAPQTADSGAKAIAIAVVPAPAGKSEPAGQPGDATITGTIILVDDVSPDADAVVVITQPDGSDSAASIGADTIVIVDGINVTVGDLQPGQQVEIVLDEDGISANEVHVSSVDAVPSSTAVPSSGEPAAGSGTEVTTTVHTLTGTVRQVIGDDVVLDDVRLNMRGPGPSPTQSHVGMKIRLQVVIDDAGNWIVLGIDE